MKNTLSTPFIVAVTACFGAIALPLGLRAPATHAGDASAQPESPPAAADPVSAGGAWQTLHEAVQTYLPNPAGSDSEQTCAGRWRSTSSPTTTPRACRRAFRHSPSSKPS